MSFGADGAILPVESVGTKGSPPSYFFVLPALPVSAECFFADAKAGTHFFGGSEFPSGAPPVTVKIVLGFRDKKAPPELSDGAIVVVFYYQIL